CRPIVTVCAAVAALVSGCADTMRGASTPDERTSYSIEHGWAKLDRAWGSTSTVAVDAQGNVWVFERCGANTCAGSNLAPILEFDASGKLLQSFGAGMFIFPHGMSIDKDGNLWLTDGQGRDGKGHQVFKLSPAGKVLMVLGKAGVPGDGPDTFNQPNAVA